MSDKMDPLAAIRENETAVKELAERSDTLGATAQCLLKWARDEQPLDTTVERSHFNLDVDTGSSGAFEDILTSSPVYDGPAPSADALESATDRVLEHTSK